MESKKLNQISIDIPNYNGPLEVLLDLAKTQKVDLAEISIALLADQFLDFIKNNENLNLETASEYLLMATWLAYLKSKLLLPDDEDDDFKVLEVAEKLKLQLKKLELIRILSDQILKKKRLGVHIFSRGMKGGIKSINSPVYDISLYELLKSYSTLQMQSTFKTINIPKLPVFLFCGLFLKLFGIKSSSFFQSMSLPKNSFILLMPSSVVNTGSLGIFIR